MEDGHRLAGILPAVRQRVNAQCVHELSAHLSRRKFRRRAKHVGLVYCLDAMKRKEAAFFVLDTHAGRGYYDLHAAEAQKSGEAERGIQRLLRADGAREPLAAYFAALGARPGERLTRYPGSPALIAAALRPQDRAVCSELIAGRGARRRTRDLLDRPISRGSGRRLRRAAIASAAAGTAWPGADRPAV